MTEDGLIGKQLGEYRLEALLAQGGMARVYRAMDVRLKRYVVVKVIDPPFRNDPDHLMRFEREAQAIARLDHPNIVRLYRFDEQDDWLYMAMQYVQGADLGVVLAGYRADKEFMEPEDARRIIGEVCSALDYAHQKGVIHRDVKPANILLDQQGRAFLTDFGLALVIEVGTRGEIFGSPHYIAPEQAISSAKAVPQSDLYAVGVILFEMFTGDVPFNAAEPLDIALLHMSEVPPPPRQLRPDINPELEEVILNALAKKPEDRYSTGAALSEALDRSLKARSAATLLAKRSTAARQTIPERVALKLGQPPLPPIPAAVATPTPLPVEGAVSPEPVVSPANKRSMIFTGTVIGLGLLLFALFCLTLFTIPSLMNRLSQKGIIPAGQNSTLLPASSLASAATSSAITPDTTSALTPSPETDAIALLPTERPVSYELFIVRGGDGNSVVVINLTTDAFPLFQLRLGSSNSVLTGAAWGVTNLESGECVGAWKAGEDHTVPGGLNCQLVGTRRELKKKDLFGGETFLVYYDGKKVGQCDENQYQCSIRFTP
jgi:serine/threonine protein kinase